MKLLIHSRMDKLFNPTHYWACDYLCMLEIDLNFRGLFYKDYLNQKRILFAEKLQLHLINYAPGAESI